MIPLFLIINILQILEGVNCKCFKSLSDQILHWVECHRNDVYIVYMCAVLGEMKLTRTFIKFVLWLRCVWFVSVYLPTVATGVLSHYAEGQMSQNASQRDRLVTPVDLQPHGALSADRIQYIRRLLVPNTIWRAPMEVKDTFSLRMSESLWSKILAVSTWREYMTHKVKKKKKSLFVKISPL